MARLQYMNAKDLANQRCASDERREWIRHQVATGELVIRQATPEERVRYGIFASAAPRSTRRRAIAAPGGRARGLDRTLSRAA